MKKPVYEYDVLNGKKYKRLLKAYIEHVRMISGTDLLDNDMIEVTNMTQADALDLTIVQHIND